MQINGDVQSDWIALVNPMAGNRKTRDHWEALARLLSQHQLTRAHHFTEYRRHSIPLIHSFLEQGCHKFLLVGGDGILNEAVNAIFTQAIVDPSLVTLALIPVGTGNDWARTFNIPSDPEAAIQIIRNGKTLRHDIGRVFYHARAAEQSWYFINMCGIGFDAEVTKKVTADGERNHLGAMKYRYHLFTSLLGYRATQMTLIVDGTAFDNEVFSVAVGIGRYNGGGMKQLPFAVPDDGVFDLTVIGAVTRMKVMRSVNKLYDGSFVGLPEVSTHTGKAIQITSDPTCWLEADGEVLGEAPFRFAMFPRALQVIIP